MRRLKIRRPSPAMVVALIALVVAVGGTSYAALKLPKNSVGSKQLKKNSVVTSKVKNGSLTAEDFGAAQLPRGEQGEKGGKGDQGLPGTPGAALAYGHVNADGSLDMANSKNIVGSSESPTFPSGGVYCIDLAVPVKNVVATVDSVNDGTAVAQLTSTLGCPAAADVTVNTFDASSNTGLPFYILFN